MAFGNIFKQRQLRLKALQPEQESVVKPTAAPTYTPGVTMNRLAPAQAGGGMSKTAVDPNSGAIRPRRRISFGRWG